MKDDAQRLDWICKVASCRTLFLSFYVLSHSPSLLNKYISLIQKLVCPRHWIQAQYLPGIVSYLNLRILHCPKIYLLSSLLAPFLKFMTNNSPWDYTKCVLNLLHPINTTLSPSPNLIFSVTSFEAYPLTNSLLNSLNILKPTSLENF